ncbi:MAG TPA: methyltransferase domain-containing protein [Bryobacteraceae bacterium]|nr:methyltransferase domain-containing protein [Bryobacteraceae bacterium]
METLFASPTLAAGYARSRPPVHPRVLDRVRRHLGIQERLECAVDIGCGAGLSTRPLSALARTAVGIEPLEPMLGWTREVAPDSHFLVGLAEQLPLRDNSASLMTAAGSLNYADLGRFFPEARRVLATAGKMVVYDFSQGKRMTDTPALEQWFEKFRERYPAPPFSGRPLSPELLEPLAAGFRPIGHEFYEEVLTLDHSFYVDYAMTETNVAAAVRAGVDEQGIREWCRRTLEPVFAGRPRGVVFTGYIAYFDTLCA